MFPIPIIQTRIGQPNVCTTVGKQGIQTSFIPAQISFVTGSISLIGQSGIGISQSGSSFIIGVSSEFSDSFITTGQTGQFQPSGAPSGPTIRLVSKNDPTTYIDLSSGIQIVVTGEERVNYGV